MKKIGLEKLWPPNPPRTSLVGLPGSGRHGHTSEDKSRKKKQRDDESPSLTAFVLGLWQSEKRNVIGHILSQCITYIGDVFLEAIASLIKERKEAIFKTRSRNLFCRLFFPDQNQKKIIFEYRWASYVIPDKYPSTTTQLRMQRETRPAEVSDVKSRRSRPCAQKGERWVFQQQRTTVTKAYGKEKHTEKKRQMFLTTEHMGSQQAQTHLQSQ